MNKKNQLETLIKKLEIDYFSCDDKIGCIQTFVETISISAIEDYFRTQHRFRYPFSKKFLSLLKNTVKLYFFKSNEEDLHPINIKNGIRIIKFFIKLMFFRDLEQEKVFLIDLKENILEYVDIYNMMTDRQSKGIFCDTILANMTGKIIYFPKGFLTEKYDQYFDKEIIPECREEIFVDCGSFIGDTVLSFIKNYGEGSWKELYCFEPDRENFHKLEENLAEMKNKKLFNIGVSDSKQVLGFLNKGTSGGCASESGNYQISVDSIDNIIKERVTFIKMDLEGHEIPALIGAMDHIVSDNPKMTISIYHHNTDIRTIPVLLSKNLSNIDMYIRSYGPFGVESVLYILPH